ncbi:DNA-binding MarR family transcriptional regulator [Diaminobutyricimonas aerilata]|uniref:DNA-binding MarR family transcriptional regulator n=1 Tax=Diaminobutyricimonas aerilata TaxID=1162967 RepID=A0A2M9CM13_9MICO|nr:MarR family transcriptional regulator [Diaminobutyricimonas aerilata]PJJ72932.1 DNA-binding MarR family transcriptional regulator [Diaminobutyricimonas aerilata]
MEAEQPADRPMPPFNATIALLTVSRSVERALAEALEPRGLNVRKYGILGHIASAPGLSLSELARRSGITVQSTHTLIGSLVAAGWVRSEVSANGRPAALSVTDAGTDLLAAVTADLAELDARLFATPAMRAVADALEGAMRERFEER